MVWKFFSMTSSYRLSLLLGLSGMTVFLLVTNAALTIPYYIWNVLISSFILNQRNFRNKWKEIKVINFDDETAYGSVFVLFWVILQWKNKLFFFRFGKFFVVNIQFSCFNVLLFSIVEKVKMNLMLSLLFSLRWKFVCKLFLKSELWYNPLTTCLLNFEVIVFTTLKNESLLFFTFDLNKFILDKHWKIGIVTIFFHVLLLNLDLNYQ